MVKLVSTTEFIAAIGPRVRVTGSARMPWLKPIGCQKRSTPSG
jgi:hypothetical protein